MSNQNKDEFKQKAIADTKNFINAYEASKTAQEYVTEYEAGELVAYDEDEVEQTFTVIVTRSIQGQLAAAVRALLNVTETAPVIMTMTDKRVWDNDNEFWQSESTLEVEAGEIRQVLTGASYWGVLVALLEWLEAV